MGQQCSGSSLLDPSPLQLLVFPTSLPSPEIAIKLASNAFNALGDQLSFSGKHVNGIKICFPLSQNISIECFRNSSRFLQILILSLLNTISQLERVSHPGQWYILFKKFPELLIKVLPQERFVRGQRQTHISFPNFAVSVF